MTVAARLNRVWIALLALLAVMITQQWIGGLFDSHRVATGFHDAFHGVWYALLTWLVLLVLQQRFAAFNVWLWLAGIWFGMLGLAVLGEIGKVLVERPIGFRDVLLAMSGVTAVLALWGAERGVLPVRASIVAAIVLLAASTLPLWQAQALQQYRDSLIPDLVRFDDPRAFQLIVSNSDVRVVPAPEDWAAIAGRDALAVTFADTEFPAVTFPEPVPDWASFSTLVVDVYQPDAGRRPLYLRLMVRARAEPERYLVDRRYDLEHGAHRLVVPLAELDADAGGRVADVRLVTNEEFRDRRLLIGALRLE